MAPIKAQRMRPREPQAGTSRHAPIDLTAADASDASARIPNRTNKALSSGSSRKRKVSDAAEQSSSTEKRLRKYRSAAPKAFHDIFERAISQRFYVLGRSRTGTDDAPEESFEVTGSTGNIYHVVIGQRPSCDCPHALKGNQCKHMVFVLAKVLRAPYCNVYQLALLKSELREIFANAPSTESPEQGSSGKRKSIEGDCPICFCELDPNSPESIVWCRAACGQNMHQECFQTWEKTQSRQATCPLCRSRWERDPDRASNVKKEKGKYSDGYVNVADQLGISATRDTSTYSDWHTLFPGARMRGNYRW